MSNVKPTPATILCDFYKISHRAQYPKGTQYIYSTWTPRANRKKAGVDNVVAFGFQAFIKEYLIGYFNNNFFGRPLQEVIDEYVRVIKWTLGDPEPDYRHIVDLHSLGYLPIRIRAVPEGTLVPIRTPMLTIENTLPKFFWLTNYLETLMSCFLWLPSTSATIANTYRDILEKYAMLTVGSLEGVEFQGHDFSMRGMASLDAAKYSGAGHLLSFVGTDTIPAIVFHEQYYNADIVEELVGTSIPATEHSVMCAHGKDELEAYKHIITNVYPAGFVSIVSDTWDLWKVLSDVIMPLKDVIMARDGRVVIRPDSGDPVDIICGNVQIQDLTDECDDLDICIAWMKEDLEYRVRETTVHGIAGPGETEGIFKFHDKHYNLKLDLFWNRYGKQYYYLDEIKVLSCNEIQLTPEQKGVIELLWEGFGGTITPKGYKLLDSHIGCIYGDAITLDRCEEASDRLACKGFASTNMVYGIGSFTYQYNTRDTFGFALKSTHAVIDGEEIFLYKDPVTDTDKIKKSQTGRVAVLRTDSGKIIYVDGLTIEDQEGLKENDLLKDVFVNGKLVRDHTLAEIRQRLAEERA